MRDAEADIVVGVDAGTSLVKCVAFSVTGELLDQASTSNEYISTGDDCVEQDMQATREIVLQTLTQLSTRLGADAKRIKSVSLTGQGDGMWLLDKNGLPVQNAWLWLDSRSASIAAELEAQSDYGQLFGITGTAITASQMRTQMVWLERNQPEVLDRASSCLHCKDYLYFLLTGVRATDPGEAVFTFGDFTTRNYSDEVLSILGLSHRAQLLPPIVEGLSDSDSMLSDICNLTGLPIGTQVNLAAVDVICSALGGGLYDQGSETAMTLLGTTGIHMRYGHKDSTVSLPTDKTGYTIVFPGGGYTQLQSNMSATMNIDWLLHLIKDVVAVTGNSIDNETALTHLDKIVGNSPATTTLYQPYISTAGERGPFVDSAARAGFFGFDQHTGLSELARSVYEGICFAARDCYDELGQLPVEIRVSGGGSKSESLKRILASVMNRPVRSIEREEAGAAGAAIIATVQSGYYPSIDSCVQQWVSPYLGSLVEPTTEDAAIYQRTFPVYKEHRKTQSPTWLALADIRQSRIGDSGSNPDKNAVGAPA